MCAPRTLPRTSLRVWPALGAFAVASGVAWPAFGQCPASTLTVDPALEDGRWADAVRAMRDTLSGSDRPWHCTGATVNFRRSAGGLALLDVALPSGTTIRRRVAAPEELLATLQAALIVETLPALGADEAPTDAPATTPTAGLPPPAPPDTPPAPPPAPRVTATEREPVSFIEGAVDAGMRLGSSPSYTSFALRASVAFRIRAWSLSVWWRFEPWTLRLVDRGPGRYLLDFGALGVGATWGTRALAGRIEAGPTLSVDSYSWRDQVLLPGQKETFVQVRLGAVARWSSRWRGLAFSVTLDADVSPVTLFADAPSAAIPTPPAWSAGLAAGILYGGAL